MAAPALPPDFKDLLQAFAEAEVRCLVVGGYAVAFHARPRFTKDIDLWIDPAETNVQAARRALIRFGAPAQVADQLVDAAPLDVVWLGRPPLRIDVMKAVPGGDFDRAWEGRVEADWGGVIVRVVGRGELVRIKEASGRPQDLLDLQALQDA